MSDMLSEGRIERRATSLPGYHPQQRVILLDLINDILDLAKNRKAGS